MSQSSNMIMASIRPRSLPFVVTHLCGLVATKNNKRELPYFGYFSGEKIKGWRRSTAIGKIIPWSQIKNQYMLWTLPKTLILTSGYEDDYFYSNWAGEVWFVFRGSGNFPNQQERYICSYADGEYLLPTDKLSNKST